MNMKKNAVQLAICLTLPFGLVGLATAPARAANPDPNGDRAIEFRDVFLGSLDGQYSEEQKNQLIYLPNSLLLNSTHQATSAEQLMNLLAEIQQKVDPVQLYEAGRSTTAHPYSTAKLDDVLRASGQSIEARLTIVVVPGIFGEFIKTRAFEEVFSANHSAFRDHWVKKLAAYQEASEANSVDKSALTDLSYSTEAVQRVSRPIEDLVHVSSIDDANGLPLINVILFDTKFMSLESLGHIADRADIFSRRLDKVSQILGATPQNLAFVGYSRGTPIALEMLARAKEFPQKHVWLANTRAMISLGGVVYGSDLADEAVNSKAKSTPPASAQQLTLLGQFKDSLELIGDRKKDAFAIVAHNAAKWTLFLTQMAYVTNPPSGLIHKFFKFFGQDNPLIALQKKLGELVSGEQMLQRLDGGAGTDMAMSFAYKAFSLKHPVIDNDANVKRFQALASAVIDGATELATSARTTWWRQNIVPTQGIKYYAIAGTMVDDVGGGLQHELATNRTTYNPDLLDYGMLMGNYRDFRSASGIAANDSQVAAYKVRFWPELNHLLNPEQPEMDQSFLGVVGVHHWGLALRVVNVPDARKITVPFDPFPRRTLLKALGTIVVKDYTGKSLD